MNLGDIKEEKALRKQQQTDGFGDIPYRTYYYCKHDNKRLDTHIKRIPINKLPQYETQCGSVGSKPFNPTVIQFLKDKSGKDFVIGEVYNDSKTVVGLAVHWKGNETTKLCNTDKFSDMISKLGGSLRADQCFEEGWDTYESE